MPEPHWHGNNPPVDDDGGAGGGGGIVIRQLDSWALTDTADVNDGGLMKLKIGELAAGDFVIGGGIISTQYPGEADPADEISLLAGIPPSPWDDGERMLPTMSLGDTGSSEGWEANFIVAEAPSNDSANVGTQFRPLLATTALDVVAIWTNIVPGTPHESGQFGAFLVVMPGFTWSFA